MRPFGFLDLLKVWLRTKGSFTRLDLLTPAERRVYDLLCKGAKNRDIAQALSVEVSTVKSHVRSIFRKLDIHDRREVGAFYHLSIEGSKEHEGTGANKACFYYGRFRRAKKVLRRFIRVRR